MLRSCEPSIQVLLRARYQPEPFVKTRITHTTLETASLAACSAAFPLLDAS